MLALRPKITINYISENPMHYTECVWIMNSTEIFKEDNVLLKKRKNFGPLGQVHACIHILLFLLVNGVICPCVCVCVCACTYMCVCVCLCVSVYVCYSVCIILFLCASVAM